MNIENNENLNISEPQVLSNHKPSFVARFKTYSLIKKILIGFGLYIAFSLVVGFINPSSDDGTAFLRDEQKISEINGRWQIEARRIEVLITDITDGKITDTVEVQSNLNDIRSRISPILVELSDHCRTLPESKSGLSGEAAAKDGAYEMLREWCRITPAQTLELYSIVNAQISSGSTQMDIDRHILAYQSLQREKLLAIKAGMTGLLPYVSGTDESTAKTLLATVDQQLSSL